MIFLFNYQETLWSKEKLYWTYKACFIVRYQVCSEYFSPNKFSEIRAETYVGLHVKWSSEFSYINEDWQGSDKFRNILQYQIHRESVQEVLKFASCSRTGLYMHSRSQRLLSPGHALPLKHRERGFESYSVYWYRGPAMGRSHVQGALPNGYMIYNFIRQFYIKIFQRAQPIKAEEEYLTLPYRLSSHFIKMYR
jgi:hypothetical protein